MLNRLEDANVMARQEVNRVEADGDLAHDVGAEADARELGELVLDVVADVRELEIAAAEAALAEEAFGRRVERHELHAARRRVGWRAM